MCCLGGSALLRPGMPGVAGVAGKMHVAQTAALDERASVVWVGSAPVYFALCVDVPGVTGIARATETGMTGVGAGVTGLGVVW